ncbi:MAG: MFS transporter [Clostridia bacterium]|nr:MFS transporter [Clostridia bacterium]
MIDLNQKDYKRSRSMYIAFAALEYLIAILLAGSFLARITGELGISDGLTGIISSFVSLGCLFQMISMFIKPKSSKKFTIYMTLVNNLLFMFLYILPLLDLPQAVSTIAFVVIILLAYLVYNIASPSKTNWFMSLVDDKQRGIFSANKEIISLISGIVFTFVMGRIIDYYKGIGEIRTAFVISAVCIFLVGTASLLTMVFTVETPVTQAKAEDQKNVLRGMLQVFKDKTVLKVTTLFVLWRIATYSASSFYGSYEIHDLALEQTVIAVLTATGSVARILVSRFWGKYADKNSFARMIRICFLIAMGAYAAMAFATPKTGVVCLASYNILHGIAMGGINSALINLVFDYVSVEKRSDSIALSQAVSGAAGFLATVCASPLVTYVQGNGNRIFGMQIYAQQFLSVVAVLMTGVCILYVTFVFIRKDKKKA